MSDNEERSRAAVIAEARSWLRTPWHHMGRVKGAGVDCATLLAEVYHAAGLVPEIEPEEYPMDHMMHRDEERLVAWIEKYAARTEAPRPGDVVVYRFGRTFSHGGIVIDDAHLLHAYREERAVVIGELHGGRLAGREMRFYTLWSA